MNKIGVYIILVIIGGVLGASALYVLIPNQTPSVAEQVKVTIQRIEYIKSNYSVLEIELLNDAPEKNLDGIVGIFQGDKQWTSEVTWYYTGQGEAVILCDMINENQSFRITYDEKNPKATYLDRTIEWIEVEKEEMVIGFMETTELTVTDVTFDATNNNMAVAITNSGTSDTTISMIKVNGDTILSGAITGSLSFDAGTTHTIEIDYSVTAGNKYAINFFANDGTLVGSYTTIAGTSSTVSQAGAVLTVENVRFYSTNKIEVILRNSGTGDAKVESVYVGTSSSNLILQSSLEYNPSSQVVIAGSNLNITITHTWADGIRYYFNMGTEEGVSIPFSREA